MQGRYRHAVMWESGSIAYHAKTMSEVKQPLCGSLKLGLPFRIPFAMLQCNAKLPGYVLCELDTDTDLARNITAKHLVEMVRPDTNHTVSPRNTSSPFAENLISCPASHITFTFLACDVLSRCYAESDDVIYVDQSRDYHLPTRSSCPAPLTSLPPALLCQNGGHRVAYTLVCDHRDDCGDGSDEDFCVFPPCEMNAPLQCSSSKEVSQAEAAMGFSHSCCCCLLLVFVGCLNSSFWAMYEITANSACSLCTSFGICL